MKRGEKVFWVLFAIFCFPFWLITTIDKAMKKIK